MNKGLVGEIFRVLRWLGSICLVLIGLLLLVPGFLTFGRDWQPTRNLYENDIARIRAASAFVENHKARIGRLPNTSEFKRWAEAAPRELTLDGVGFTYRLEREDSSYVFDWYGGRGAWVWWKPDAPLDVAYISNYFVFGSKVFDLLIFFALAAGAFCAAKRLATAPRSGSSASADL